MCKWDALLWEADVIKVEDPEFFSGYVVSEVLGNTQVKA